MSRFGSLFLGFVLGAAAMFVSLKYHVLRTDQGVELVPKVTSTFGDTYVDIRHFGLSDWREHKSLLAAVVRSEKKHLLHDAATTDLGNAIDGLFDEIGFEPEKL